MNVDIKFEVFDVVNKIIALIKSLIADVKAMLG